MNRGDGSGTDASVDVVMVTTDDREMVLESLEYYTDPAIARLTLVVNASLDGTLEGVRERFPDVDLVGFEQRAGLSATRNRGWIRGEAPLVLFADDDARPEPGAITKLAQTLAAEPGASAAGPRLVDPETRETQEQYRPRTFPGLTVFATRVLDVERLWPSNPVTQRHWGTWLDGRETVRVDQPGGGFLLVRRAQLAAIGGYDEDYWLTYDDTDFSRRLSRYGPALYVPSAVVGHVGRGHMRRLGAPEAVRIRYQGMFRYTEVHFSWLKRAVLALCILLVSLPRIVVFSLWRPQMARAYLAVVRAALEVFGGTRSPRLYPVPTRASG